MNGTRDTKQRVSLLLVGVLVLLPLSACETTRDVLGMTKQGPDEFAQPLLDKKLVIPPCPDVLPRPQTTGEEQDPFPNARSCDVHPPADETEGSRSLQKKLALGSSPSQRQDLSE